MKKLYLFILLSFICANVNAQNFAREQEEIQRRQQQETQERLRARDMIMRERAFTNTQELALEAEQRTGDKGEGGCLDIKYLRVSGVTKFKQDYIKKQVISMLGQCVNKAVLQDIQAGIQKIYIDKGYIGARVYFDFSETLDKRLNVIVSEGVLEDIMLLDPKTKEPLNNFPSQLKVFTAFPYTKGRILNLRDIEQGLEQMNKLSSNNAIMEVRPGTEEGGSVVIVDNAPLPKNNIGVSYDNAGSKSTGKYRGSAFYSRDNLFSANENIYINAASTLWNNTDVRYSKSLTASVIVPFGYWTLTNSFSYSKYLTTVTGTATSFESSGESKSNTLALERMLARGRTYKLSAGAQLAVKDSKNYIENVFVESSSRLLSVGSLYLAGTYYSTAGSIFSKLSVNRGLDIFGAKKDENLSSGSPRAQFTSLSLYINYSTGFGPFNYTSSFDGQFGFDDLFSSEQIFIGSESTVRGFKENSAFGDRGFVLRQDLRVPVIKFLGESKNEYINKFLTNTHAGVFADYGFASPKSYGDNASLAGAGAKINYYGKYLNGGFTYAKRIYSPDWIAGEGDVFYFNLALNIFF